jgi:4-diphosphocytidyl-2-C-methyl-D-erythritol kinase
MALTQTAFAKVNLFLHVTGKRPDGYHLLDSLAVFPGAADILHVSGAVALSLIITGPFGAALTAEPDNLVLRAARALAAAANINEGAVLTLEKHLPVASGIGGGSADAAAALLLLSQLWGVKLPLEPIALSLGADVPVCLAAKAKRMGGIGEILTPAPLLPPYGMVLINPGVAVSTAAVFHGRSAAFSEAASLPQGWRQARFMATDLAELRNDLEASAVALAPAIGLVLRLMRADRRCLLARMSGSGATCFGLYDSPAIAKEAADVIRRREWWVWTGGVAEGGPTDI